MTHEIRAKKFVKGLSVTEKSGTAEEKSELDPLQDQGSHPRRLGECCRSQASTVSLVGDSGTLRLLQRT